MEEEVDSLRAQLEAADERARAAESLSRDSQLDSDLDREGLKSQLRNERAWNSDLESCLKAAETRIEELEQQVGSSSEISKERFAELEQDTLKHKQLVDAFQEEVNRWKLMTFAPDRSVSEYTSLVGQARAVFMGSQNTIQNLERQIEKLTEKFEGEIHEATQEITFMKEFFLRHFDEDREKIEAVCLSEITMQDLKSSLWTHSISSMNALPLAAFDKQYWHRQLLTTQLNGLQSEFRATL